MTIARSVLLLVVFASGACRKTEGAVERARARAAASGVVVDAPAIETADEGSRSRARAAASRVVGDAPAVETADEAARKRVERQTPVATVAPAPAPNDAALPIVGTPDFTADGHPKQHVDRGALRRLLRDQRYTDLEAHFGAFQSKFEADPRYEYWPFEAADAFATADPEVTAQLNAWVAATPASFAAHLARATHGVRVAWAKRGNKFVKATNADNLVEMRVALDAAVRDADRALALRPRLVAAQRVRLKAQLGRAQMEAALAEALAACPTCFLVRVAYVANRTPRWGGSYAEMLAVASAAPVDANPRLRLLPGYVDVDQANRLMIDDKPDEALAAIERACALGEHADFLLARAEIHRRRGDLSAARRDLDRAWELHPGDRAIRMEQAVVAWKAKEYETAGEALLDVVRDDPTDTAARKQFPSVVQGAIFAGWQHHQAGRKDDALRLLDLALALDPLNTDAQRRRVNVVAGARASSPDEIEALREKAKAAPDDFRAHQALDYALARAQRFDEVVAMWDEYLARRPADGPAHLERGGALWHLGRPDEARKSAQRACDLGVSEGCVRAQ